MCAKRNDEKKRSCYTFQRGNMLFTTEPPASDQCFVSENITDNVEKQSKSSDANLKSRSDMTSPVKSINYLDQCEVCSGMRSPSSARRANSFTTHFCTRISTRQPKVASGASLAPLERNESAVQVTGHVSRLSAFVEEKAKKDVDVSIKANKGAYSLSSLNRQTSTKSFSSVGQQSDNSDDSRLCSDSNSSSFSRSTLTSLYPSLESGSSLYSSFGTSSFDYNDYSSSSSCDMSDIAKDMQTKSSIYDGRNKNKISYSSSRNTFNSLSDVTSDSNSEYSSEMNWSFNSLCEENPNMRKTMKTNTNTTTSFTNEDSSINAPSQLPRNSNTNVSPFTLNENRKQDVMEKFGTVVSAFKKPGHHVGPSKNPDCQCNNCRIYFNENHN